MEHKQKELIVKAYKSFNERNINAVFETMQPDIHWPNGWEGGYVDGFDAVRDYWTRQWQELNPIVVPTTFKVLNDNTVEVSVHQLVKDLYGNVLYDGDITHIYTFMDGLIKKMEIVKPAE